MSLLDGLIGNASQANAQEVQAMLGQILILDEKVECAYKLVRDYFVFTDKRLILADVQGITGAKTEYHSIPYKSITHFSFETAGTFDLDAEMKIWIASTAVPIEKKFNSRLDIHELQRALSTFVLGAASRVIIPHVGGNPHTRANPSQITGMAQHSFIKSVSESGPSEELEFCFHCGESINENTNVCSSCGKSL